jgi:pyruvate kinase
MDAQNKVSADSHNIKFNNIFEDIECQKRRTKIICTLGPACNQVEKLAEMIDAGMNISRLNFSHGDHESHGKQVDNLRAAMKMHPKKHVALMLDTKGPEIRTGQLVDGKNIDLKIGQKLEITTDYTIKGDNTIISCSYPGLPTSVKVGGTIFIADGSLVCIVEEIKEVSALIHSGRLQPICAPPCKDNININTTIYIITTAAAAQIIRGLLENIELILFRLEIRHVQSHERCHYW